MKSMALGLGGLRSALRNRISARPGRVPPRRGGAVMETALVMALLIMLSFGTAEYGYFFFVKNTLAGAARDGVRAAIPSTAANSDVISAISTAMTAAHITSYSYTFSPADISTATQGTPVTVTVTCTWGTVGVTPLPVAMGGIATSKQVVGVAVMRKES